MRTASALPRDPSAPLPVSPSPIALLGMAGPVHEPQSLSAPLHAPFAILSSPAGDGGVRLPHKTSGAGPQVRSPATRPCVLHGGSSAGQQGRGRFRRVHFFPASVRAAPGRVRTSEHRFVFVVRLSLSLSRYRLTLRTAARPCSEALLFRSCLDLVRVAQYLTGNVFLTLTEHTNVPAVALGCESCRRV